MKGERQVYISYSTNDVDIAHAIHDYLDSHDVCAWLASDCLPTGLPYIKAIESGISHCEALLLIYSRYCRTSYHVLPEVELSVNQNKSIIIFKVGDAPIHDVLSVKLGDKNVIKASPDCESALPTLLEAVRKELAARGESTLAIHDLQHLAEDAEAQKLLAEEYHIGNKVECSYDEAARLWRMAAEQGDIEAQNKVGECYAKGEGTGLSLTEAVKWYKENHNRSREVVSQGGRTGKRGGARKFDEFRQELVMAYNRDMPCLITRMN